MAALKCDVCGGQLAMDSRGEFAVCKNCGTEHDKCRMQAKIQEIQGTVKVEGIHSIEKLVENATTFKRLEDWRKVEDTYKEITNQYPEDYRGWWGLIECQTHDFKDVKQLNNTSYDWYNRALKVCDDTNISEELKERYENALIQQKNIIDEENRQAELQRLDAERKRKEQERLEFQKKAADEKAKREEQERKAQEKQQAKNRERLSCVTIIGISIIFLIVFFKKLLPIFVESDYFVEILPVIISYAVFSLIIGLVDGVLSGYSGASTVISIIVTIIIAISSGVGMWIASYGHDFFERILLFPFTVVICGVAGFIISLLHCVGLIFEKKDKGE